MPSKAPPLTRSATAPIGLVPEEEPSADAVSGSSGAPSLLRRKTTPNRMVYERVRASFKSKGAVASSSRPTSSAGPKQPLPLLREQQVRRMKSVDEPKRRAELYPQPFLAASSTGALPLLASRFVQES